ncbi:MAG: tetratricopeptide repeat protein, partial [Candidatus Krumholzibacteria bacterium]|nr:tetratricopeptide repeat protein [Candidatus Krumholzibacteria bacterium]
KKHIVIIKGKSGEGKTRFLQVITRKLRQEWGFKGGGILNEQSLLHNIEQNGLPEKYDFLLIDDHTREPSLGCHIIDKLCCEMERYKLAVVAVNEEPPPHFLESLHEECKKKEISIKEITLPTHGKTEKNKILSLLLPTNLGKSVLKGLDTKQSLAFMNYAVKAQIHNSERTRTKELTSFLDLLSTEERSVLSFLAVLNFEAPLSFLQNIYSTEENGIYTTLQHLNVMGLMDVRAEKSNLAGGDLSLVYSLSGRALAEAVLESIPAKRKRQIHKNIALILKEMENAPSLYIFYHLVGGGEKSEAAIKGYELFNSLLKNKKISAINYFTESYLDMKLDRYLPVETRFNMFLELGNYFSLIGNIGKAEKLYRRCREETSREKQSRELKALAVEAVRRECEILEKKGEFLKAQKLLEKAMDIQGEYLPSNERAKLYNDLAWIHYRLGRFDRSWENCLLVHEFIDEKQYPIEIAQAYNLMGAINWNRSKYDDAILCHKRCLTIRGNCSDEIGIASSYNNLGLVYRSMGRVKKALECFKKSMEIKQKHNNMQGMAAAHLNLALTYLDMENFKEAERNCSYASRLAKDIGNQQLLAE